MAVNFQDSEIELAWAEVFAKDEYRIAIAEIADKYPEHKSLNVDYADINVYSVDFAMFILDYPDRCLGLARKTVMSLVPNVSRPGDVINVRIHNLPRDATVEIRNLRSEHLLKLVAVEGLARKVTAVKPRLTHALFRCARCGAETWVEENGMILREPIMCSNPEGGCNKQAVRFILDQNASVYTDTQKIEIQESPEGLRGGAQPERITGYVEDDIAGQVTAGNRITLIGVLRAVEKPDRDKTTVFDTFLDVLAVEFEQHEYDEIQITAEDEEKIQEMSRDPELFNNIVQSISPTINGLEDVKRAIALQLFGGSHKTLDDGTVIRGDMHILLIGDPGVAKSQLLRYMSMLAPRGIYASGKSASAAGLTAAAVRDDFGDGRWTLEAGALVLADKGLACIDELDKMTDQDRSSLHEAMESQKISVAKAGITATLQCRCSMLAAANPKFGRFDEGASIYDQINLPPALMSRFDLIFVLRDKPEQKRDRQITDHILSAHQRGQARQVSEDVRIEGVDLAGIIEKTNNIRPIYDVEILRKYVAYSKRIVPIMTDEALNIIRDSYLSIRKTAKEDSVPITARQLEAFVRLSEASAKMRLSDTVTDLDANRAVDLVEYYLRGIAGTEDGSFDIGKVDTDKNKVRSDKRKIVKRVIAGAGEAGITMEDIVISCGHEGMAPDEVERIVRKLHESGEIFQAPSTQEYKAV